MANSELMLLFTPCLLQLPPGDPEAHTCAHLSLAPLPMGYLCRHNHREHLSATMQAALGATGVEGAFRKGCEHVMRVARRHSTTLSSLLQSVLLDPLVTWSPDRDQAASKKVC